jgi:uncharacterized protein (TIGR02246 family)
MKIFSALCAAVLTVLLGGCNQTATDTQAEVKALRDNEVQWNQDFVSKNVDKLLSHYADNAVLMAPGTPTSVGKDAIRKTLAEMLTDPALTLQFQASRVEVAKSGDMAYTQGLYTMTMTAPNKQVINDHGSYVTTYSKQPDGSWKAVADIATSEVPPPAPAPSAHSTK